MKIVFLGLTLTSSWGNGHATTYRSLCRALHARGHRICFFEKDLEWYRGSRDLPHPDFCDLHFYSCWEDTVPNLLRQIRDADAVILGSYFPDGVAAADLLVENARCPVLFYDIDTPVTLAALRKQGNAEYLEARQIPHFDAYLSFTCGPILEELRTRFGARRTIPLYCSVDPDRHFRRTPSHRYQCDLSYLGTYSSDRQPKLERYLCRPALALPSRRFLVAGSQYPEELEWPANVERLKHIAPPQHPSFYSSSRFTLNLTRRDMMRAGYSPSVRLFEAAACGTAILSDTWPGLETFFATGKEILLPDSSEETVAILENLSEREIRSVGDAARARILGCHTAAHRAIELEEAIALCYEGREDLRVQARSENSLAEVARSGSNSSSEERQMSGPAARSSR